MTVRKNVKKIAAAAGILPLAMGVATLTAPSPRPTPTARAAATAEAKCPELLSDCPKEGCGGDPALNKLKNRIDKPAAAKVEEWKLSDIIDLNENSPQTWSKTNSRKSLKTLGEGTPVIVKGLLVHAEPYRGGEGCNCGLKGNDNIDFHLNLVARKNDSRDDSVVVELTPRARLAGWTVPKLNKLGDMESAPAYVRVTGWLLFDSQHPSFANFAHLHRGTAWEVHPVTKFEVCTLSKVKCDLGNGWKPLEQFP